LVNQIAAKPNFMKNQHSFRVTLGKLLAVAAGCLAFQSAQATLLFQEGFNYTAGSGVGGNINPGSGVAWSGNNNVTVDGTDPLLTYSGLNNISTYNMKMVWGIGSGTVKNDPAFSTVGSGQVYYSFLLDMTALPTTTSSGGTYLTALNAAGGSPNGSSDAVDLYVNSAGVLKMESKGVASSSGFTASLNTTYLVVLEYDFSANLASAYFDPTSSSFGGSAPSAYATATPASGSITGLGDVGFKAQTSSGTTAGTFLINNLLIGTTWADVTPTATPEPSTLALAGFGGVCLLGLGTRVRRSRG
jgi:PEP-CTERM motif